MRWRYITKIVGVLNVFFGLTMVFPVICGLYYADSSIKPLLESMGLTIGAGAVLYFAFRGPRQRFSPSGRGWPSSPFHGRPSD